MRFGIGFGIGFGMDSEWIRNSIQKEGFTCTEAIIIFGDIGIVIFVTGAVIGDVGLPISCILEPEQEMSWVARERFLWCLFSLAGFWKRIGMIIRTRELPRWNWCLCWWGPCGVGISSWWVGFHCAYWSVIIARESLCKQQLAKTQESTQIVWRHVAVHIHRLCRRIYFSMCCLQRDLFPWKCLGVSNTNTENSLFFNGVCPRKSWKIFRGRSGTLAKSREGQQLLAGGVSAAVDIIPGRGWHHARAEKLWRS